MTNNLANTTHIIEKEDKDDELLVLNHLFHEINLLRIEGFYFSFDSKTSSSSKGEHRHLERIKTPNGYIEKQVVIEPHPEYGRPGPLAYKILQAIMRKYSDYYYPFPEYVPFSQRAISRWVGRNSWGGHTQQQFKQAIRQLLRTVIYCSFYDKESQTLKEIEILLLVEASFSTKNGQLNECMVQLHPRIVKSLNNYHFFCLNQLRMEKLPPIATALYKHLFYHFSNIYSQTKDKKRPFRKDYQAICNTWLGGLKVHKYKSLILRDQLGYHFKLLKKCQLVKKIEIEKSATEGFNITFYPGNGFLEDYNRFYGNKNQLKLDFQKASDNYNTVKPMKVVSYFYKKLHGMNEFPDIMLCNQGDLDYARELLDNHSYETLTKLIDYSIIQAKKTNFEMQRFVAVKTYLVGFFALQQKFIESAERKQKTRERELERKKATEKLEQQKKQYEAYVNTEVKNYKSTLSSDKLKQIKNGLIKKNMVCGILDPNTDIFRSVFNNHLRELADIPSFEEWQPNRK